MTLVLFQLLYFVTVLPPKYRVRFIKTIAIYKEHSSILLTLLFTMAYTVTVYSIYMLNIIMCIPSQYTLFSVNINSLMNSFVHCCVFCDSLEEKRPYCYIIHLFKKRYCLVSSIVPCGVYCGSKQCKLQYTTVVVVTLFQKKTFSGRLLFS